MIFRQLPLVSLFLALLLSQFAWAWTPTHRLKTRRGQVYLRLLNNHSLLFAYRPGQESLAEVENSPLWSPEFRVATQGGTQVQELKLGQSVPLGEGRSLNLLMDPVRRNLSLELKQKQAAGGVRSYRFDFSQAGKGGSRVLRMRASHIDHLYGLGEHLPVSLLGQADGGLKGQLRHSGTSPESLTEDERGVYGNSMVSLGGGMVGNALFPSLMMLDDTGPDALLFLANHADSSWDFRISPWTVNVREGEIEGALAWGLEARELRKELMTWAGRAPVPPRKAFGMWVSEYGYENWAELESKAKGLRASGFPVDGFVLDLQWFGGITENSPDSRMGTLTFDTENFPNPSQKILELAKSGLGLVVIEEPYICQGLPEFADLAKRNFLVRSKVGESTPHIVDETPWWGLGSMLDYTNPAAADYWHQTKREPLRELGIMGHWTDLGEPEVFRHKESKSRRRQAYSTPIYHGDRTQLQANNLFGFRWAESIFRGYGRGDGGGPRPFILARTGTTGIWRFGACLWSGDIGANWESLRSHYRAQAHVAMSGLDYFGSDVGGFYRKSFQQAPGGFGELYTRWFAAACLTDVPLRPHTMNLGNKYETAPHLVGDKASNLANLKQRYQLIPYLYSAAHRAWAEGESVVAPVALFEQDNGKLDVSGTHKMLGADLLARLVLAAGEKEVEVMFPRGRWYDFESGGLVCDGKSSTAKVPATLDGLLRTPLFAREGSLIPLGSPGSSRPDTSKLELRVFPGTKVGTGLLVEDDGWSQAYRRGEVARTKLSQTAWKGRYGQVVIGARSGDAASSLPPRRDVTIWLASGARDLRAFQGESELGASRHGGFWKVVIPQASASRDLVITFR